MERDHNIGHNPDTRRFAPMTTLAALEKPAVRRPTALFVVTVFASAALVFLVEPMLAKLVLPLLGGSPSVWNTSLAFFQTALLAGYGYAHLLQRIRSVRVQALTHCAVLALTALALPLRVNELFGPPSSTHPALWLLGVLAVSIGAPFAALSATAPLVQAWYARTRAGDGGKEPYALYAASNLGSLLALLAYPIVVEPSLTVHAQTAGWTVGYAAFVVLMASLAFFVSRAASAGDASPAEQQTAPRPAWRERLTWVALAAIPSSLMLGVTTHITMDVASAPFLWVAPLALYLVTFVIAFQAKPAIKPESTLLLQGAAIAACAAYLPFSAGNFTIQLFINLAAFFLTALMCHQALVARRPDPAHLTEFYLWMSLGGVVGGGFNALLAPMIFNNVWEYPLVIVLSCLVRPWGPSRTPVRIWMLLALGVLCALATPVLMSVGTAHATAKPWLAGLSQADAVQMATKLLLGTAVVTAFLLRGRGLLFLAMVAVLSMGAQATADRVDTRQSWRSFFGVLRQSQTIATALGGPVRMLAHGTTLHGAQASDPRWRCYPLVYYTPLTPIGQVFTALQNEKPAIRAGAVGLGTGSVAAYVRASDRLTFFEIDPLVIRISTDPSHFSYTTECAKGPIDYVVGDARLTLAAQPKGVFDVLLIDAFSSDSVPAHLLTVEAVRGYLTHLKPDGVLILHLSNRNLDLKGPAQAVARAAGGVALLQEYKSSRGQFWESDEDAVIIGRSPAALARFADDGRWKPGDPTKARPWTDDYTNLPGALWRRLKEKWSGEP
jgi:SAM-dependent methyltransferase